MFLKLALSNLLAFGTDGEECLFNAFSVQFPQACYVRCFLHFLENCKAKLLEMKVSNDVLLEIIQDVFGSLIRGKPGLVDDFTAGDLRNQFNQVKPNGKILLQVFTTGFLNTNCKKLRIQCCHPFDKLLD